MEEFIKLTPGEVIVILFGILVKVTLNMSPEFMTRRELAGSA
ncbi:MAG: hypothetical protein ACMUHM_07065 [Thermoplasmatota archaeon]